MEIIGTILVFLMMFLGGFIFGFFWHEIKNDEINLESRNDRDD